MIPKDAWYGLRQTNWRTGNLTQAYSITLWGKDYTFFPEHQHKYQHPGVYILIPEEILFRPKWLTCKCDCPGLSCLIYNCSMVSLWCSYVFGMCVILCVVCVIHVCMFLCCCLRYSYVGMFSFYDMLLYSCTFRRMKFVNDSCDFLVFVLMCL